MKWTRKTTEPSINIKNANRAITSDGNTITVKDINAYKKEVFKILSKSSVLSNANNLPPVEFQKVLKAIPSSEINKVISEVLNIVIPTSVKDIHLDIVIALTQLKDGQPDKHVKIIELLK